MMALAVAMAAGSAPVVQADTLKPFDFFGRLFGPRDPNAGRNPFLLFPGPPPPSQYQPQRPRRIAPAITEPPMPAVVIQPKDPKARKILVVGDFVADGLAWGLDQQLADEPKLAVIDRANTGSGLAREDYYDWDKSLPDILNQEKPDVVVVALGANDRQQLRVGNQRYAMHSPQWEDVYGKRIDGLVDTLKVYGRPFFWVGAPPMRTSAISADMAYLNGLFKARVEPAGGHFVDVWNGFVDDNGQFIASGPDVDGQVRALRAGDGINFTRAGRVKLSFFVEREMRQQTGIAPGGIDLTPSASQESRIEIGPDGRKVLVGPVISLTDPLPATSKTLAGGGEPAMPASDSLQYKVIVKGDATPAVAGRADDFVWPGSGGAPAAASAPVAPASALPAGAPALGAASSGAVKAN